MHVDESHCDSWSQQRLRNPAAPARVRGGLVVLVHARENRKCDHGRDDLQQRRALKCAEPLADSRSDRDSAPNSAAEISESLAAAVNAGNLHDPRRRAGVETSLAQTLQRATKICAEYSERQQISRAGYGATEQTHEENGFAPLAVRQRTGYQTAGQRNEGETADDQSHGLIGPAKIVTHVRPDQRQNCADAKKTKESRPDQRPETGTQATTRPH